MPSIDFSKIKASDKKQSELTADSFSLVTPKRWFRQPSAFTNGTVWTIERYTFFKDESGKENPNFPCIVLKAKEGGKVEAMWLSTAVKSVEDQSQVPFQTLTPKGSFAEICQKHYSNETLTTLADVLKAIEVEVPIGKEIKFVRTRQYKASSDYTKANTVVDIELV